MDLTPQFILEKLLESAKGIERLTGLVEKQNDRIDEIEGRIDQAASDHRDELAQETDDRKERQRAILSAFYEALKGVAGAIVGAICTLALQHWMMPLR